MIYLCDDARVNQKMEWRVCKTALFCIELIGLCLNTQKATFPLSTAHDGPVVNLSFTLTVTFIWNKPMHWVSVFFNEVQTRKLYHVPRHAVPPQSPPPSSMRGSFCAPRQKGFLSLSLSLSISLSPLSSLPCNPKGLACPVLHPALSLSQSDAPRRRLALTLEAAAQSLRRDHKGCLHPWWGFCQVSTEWPAAHTNKHTTGSA